MVDVRCRVCGHETEALQRTGGSITPCDHNGCAGERERIYRNNPARAAVHGDDIPGGMTFKHGICNEDGTARTFYTKHDIREATKAAGLLSMEEAGQPIPVLTDEIEQMVKRPGYGNPRVSVCPSVLSAEDEAARVRHWRETEKQLQQEMK